MIRRHVRTPLVAVLGALVVVAGTWWVDSFQRADRPLDVRGCLLAGAAGAALGFSRRAPLASLGAVVGFAAVYLLGGYAYGPVLGCVVGAMFECARRRPLRVSAFAGLAAAAGSVAAVAPRLAGHFVVPALGLSLWAACWLAVPLSVGALLRARAVAIERERRELVTRAVFEERIRVSREVHDVAGHGFAVVAMQAAVALVVLDEQPEQARASLAAIRATSVAALDELRAVLATAAPPHDDLRALIARSRAAGLPVTLRVDAVDGVRPELLRVAYQVVRESLTNVLRHADAAPTAVLVCRDDGHLVVTVTDRGTVAGDGRPGRGLTGMRARVEAVNGTLRTGPGKARGFVVTARLPLAGSR